MSLFKTHNKVMLRLFQKLSLFTCILFLSTSVFAEAGRVIFSAGVVTAESPTGETRRLFKRSLVDAGEIVRTSKNSMVQIRMIDKALIALRANSELKIDSYKLGVNKEEDVGIFSLLRGGFRAVTGIIGKRLRSAYKMRTHTATIGIRGTDYTARLCDNDCNQAFGNINGGKSIDNGLYVGVNQGGVDLTNELGTLDLDELQFGYVKDSTTAPVALITAPEFLYFNSSAPNPDEEASNENSEKAEQKAVLASRSSVEPDSSDVNNDDLVKTDLKADKIEVDQDQIDSNAVIDQIAETDSGTQFSLTDGTISSSRMVVTSYGNQNDVGSIASVRSNPFNSAKFDGNELTQFDNQYIDQTKGVGVYTSNSSVIDLGFDPVTKISWGRWGSGSTQFQTTNGTSAPDSSNLSSVHWVSSPDQTQSIALPSSGIQSYVWVGNTTPTDNLGNTGILGNATLEANFNNFTVDSAVDIGINNQVWNATSVNVPISNDGGFSGAFSTVNVNTGSANISGSGNTAGFINNEGAGMGFSLEANVGGTDTTVTGTAVFQKP